MWLVITYLLNFADPCLKSLIVLSHEEKLFCWRFEIMEIQLSVGAARGCGDGMRWWDGETERIQGRFPFSGKGHWAPWERLSASIKWESDTFRRNPILNRKSGMKTLYSVRYMISLPEMKFPSPRTDPSPGLNWQAHWAVSASVSPASQPFLFPNLTFSVHEK